MRTFIVAALAVTGAAAAVMVVPAQAPNGFRTPWGDPDLRGKWTSGQMAGVPLQRAESFGTRNMLTDEEFAARRTQVDRQKVQDVESFDFDNPSVPFGQVGGGQSPPQHWFERGEPQRQASLIVDPPDGRMPPMTAAAQQREARRRAERASRGPSDSYTDFSLYERCITRGVVGSILPGGYNSGNQIVQSPGYVTIVNEMIHESRIVPLDGRSHLGPAIRNYMGDSRGRWNGETLVVDTTNFKDRPGVGMNDIAPTQALRITERFRRTGATTIDYSITVDDAMTWTAPFTLQYQLKRDDAYGMFEYACHEGNYALPNILSGARAEDREASRR